MEARLDRTLQRRYRSPRNRRLANHLLRDREALIQLWWVGLWAGDGRKVSLDARQPATLLARHVVGVRSQLSARLFGARGERSFPNRFSVPLARLSTNCILVAAIDITGIKALNNYKYSWRRMPEGS